MNYYLGIDGGGTKTKFILTDEKGILLSSVSLATSHYLQCGLDGVTQIINEGVTQITKDTHIPPSSITSCFAAIPGYGDIEDDCHDIEEAVRKGMHNISFQIGNDTDNALAGSLAGKPGINIIAGTGSIALGINEQGERKRCGGWHHIFGGDEGSGYWLACKLILEFTRQSDGRDEKTQLYHTLKKELNLSADSSILTKTITEMEFDRTKIAALATHVFNLAKMNDPFALQFYREAAKELSELILTIQKTLGMQKATVSYSGGVFKGGDFILKPLQEFLSDNATLVPPILPPDAGSILLAMQMNHQEITPEILENLKNH